MLHGRSGSDALAGPAAKEREAMKPAELQMLKGKKIANQGASKPRGGGAGAQDKREQALARKRELLEKHRKAK